MWKRSEVGEAGRGRVGKGSIGEYVYIYTYKPG